MGLTTSYSKAENDIQFQNIKKLFGSGLHDTPLKISDPTPTQSGGYILADVGDYSFGNAPNGSYNVAFLSGTIWEIVSVAMPQAIKSVPQFADLTFPATNTTEKIQCIYANKNFQLKVGRTATSSDIPTGAPDDIWEDLTNDEIHNYYDSSKDKPGFWINGSGGEGTHLETHISGYIPVTFDMLNVELVLTKRPSAISAMPVIELYDKNKAFVSSIASFEYANIFKITNPNVRFFRFNTVWVGGAVQSDLRVFKNKYGEKAPFQTNEGYELVNEASLGGVPMTSGRALIADINNVSYVDLIASSTTIQLLCINVADNTSETISIKLPSTGYHRLPKELITTSFTNFYLGFYSGIYYATKLTHDSKLLSGGVLSQSVLNFSYSVGMKTQTTTDFITACLQSDGKELSGTFTLDRSFTLPKGVKIRGNNCTVNIVNESTIAVTIEDEAGFDGITFAGLKPAANYFTTPGLVKADLTNYITLSDKANPMFLLNNATAGFVTNCYFKNIDRHVLTIKGNNDSVLDQGLVAHNTFENCKSALDLNTEYAIVANNQIFNCQFSIHNHGGNLFKSNNIIRRCAVGIIYDNLTGNGAHGSYTGGCLNHISVAGIYVKAMTLGESFTGVNIFDAELYCENAGGLIFTGCNLAMKTVNITAGFTNSFVGNMFSPSYNSGVYFNDPNNTLNLKNNTIIGASNHSAVNN